MALNNVKKLSRWKQVPIGAKEHATLLAENRL